MRSVETVYLWSSDISEVLCRRYGDRAVWCGVVEMRPEAHGSGGRAEMIG